MEPQIVDDATNKAKDTLKQISLNPLRQETLSATEITAYTREYTQLLRQLHNADITTDKGYFHFYV